MKLVHQGHGVTGQDAFAQGGAAFAAQGGVEPPQHVLKPEAARLGFEQGHAFAHGLCGMAPQRGGDGGQARQLGLQRGQGVDVGGHLPTGAAGFAGIGQAFGGEALPAGFEVGHVGNFGLRRVGHLRPAGQGIEPVLPMRFAQPPAVPLGFVGGGLGVKPGLQRGHAGHPAGAQGLQALLALGGRGGQHVGQGHALPALCAGDVALGQGRHVGHETVDAGPHGVHLPPVGLGQRVGGLAPKVLRGLQAQGLFAGHQGFVKQAAAVEGVLAQHTLAPGVDGEHGRFVHGLGGGGQPPGGVLALGACGVIGQQAQQERVGCFVGGLAPEAPGGLHQPGADAVGQLAGGGAGEGHDQHVGRHQRAGKGVGPAVAQHQAHTQGGNGPGFAGAGAGFDQVAAAQRKTQRIQGLGQGWV